MMRNLKLWSGILGIVFLLASCASTAHIEKHDNTDFTKYRTFAWAEKDGSKKDRKNNLAEQKIRDAVSKELERTAGWRESKNPDVLLSYDLLVERSVKQQSEPVYSNPFTRTFYNAYSRRFYRVFYPSRFVGYDNYDLNTREGTVTISMIDANSGKTVWQGWATDEVSNRNMSQKEIDAAVRSIFKKADLAKR